MKKHQVKFFIDKNCNVYKTTTHPSMLLKLSPWKTREDRRLFNFEQNLHNFNSITSNKALELINYQFDNRSTEWIYNGELYVVFESTNDNNTTLLEFLPPSHNFNNRGDFSYYLCHHNGKIYWALRSGNYFPRTPLYKFIDINQEPNLMTDFIKWTHAKHCKTIFKYINETSQFVPI